VCAVFTLLCRLVGKLERAETGEDSKGLRKVNTAHTLLGKGLKEIFTTLAELEDTIYGLWVYAI